MTNQELVQFVKALIGTGDGSGLAAPQEAAEFVDLSRDQSYVLKEIRVESGIRMSFMLDSLNLTEPAISLATEGALPADADVIAIGRQRRPLTPVEFILPYDITYDFLRRAIGKGRAEEQINVSFAKRFAKDVLLVAFTGDTTLTGTTRTDKARKITNGFFKRAAADARARVYDLPASPSYNSVVFPQMLSQLPKDYQDEREALRFFVSMGVYNLYADEIGQRNTALGDSVLFGDWSKGLFYQGIKLLPVPGLNNDQILLTLAENLAVGFGHYMTVGRQLQERKRVIEYTLTGGMDANYVEGDALVYTIP